MAIVTALQFNTHSGAMICDEEYWFLRRRRSYFLDNIRNLIPEDLSESLGIEAAYGGWGHPGFHEEVIQRTRDEVRKMAESGSDDLPDGRGITDLEGIAMIVRKAMEDTRRRKIDDMLTYLYGFNLDDLNQGFWTENDSRYDIKQDSVLSAARGIATYQTKNHLTNPIFKNKAVVIGYDGTYEFRGYHLNAENTVCSLISGGFEAIGAGFYGAGIQFSQLMNQLTLEERRNGFDRVWGMVALFEATLNAYDHFHEVGGGLTLVYIDGEQKSHGERYHEISDDRTQLAKEIVKAYQNHLISSDQIYMFMEDLMFNNKPVKSVEKTFFSVTPDLPALRKLLRGYKIQPFPEVPEVKTKKAAAGTSRKRGK